jgi:hypothetical protein
MERAVREGNRWQLTAAASMPLPSTIREHFSL